MTISEKLNTIKTSLGNIKTAIINKGQTPSGNITTYADAIDNIQVGTETNINNQDINISSNGTYTADSGYTGLGEVIVDVPTNASVASKTITSNGTYDATSEGFDGYYEVTVDVPTSGGSANLTTLSVTPLTSSQTITASNNGYDGYSEVIVSAVDNTIDSNISAGNIKNGVSILGVTGTYSGSGSGTTLSADATTKAVIAGTLSGNVTLDNSISTLKDYAFSHNSSLVSLTANNVTSIGSNCFYECTSLRSLYLPNYTGFNLNENSGALDKNSSEAANLFGDNYFIEDFSAPYMKILPYGFSSYCIPRNLTTGTIIGVCNDNTNYVNQYNVNPLDMKFLDLPLCNFYNSSFDINNIEPHVTNGELVFSNLITAGCVLGWVTIDSLSSITQINFPALKRLVSFSSPFGTWFTPYKDLTINFTSLIGFESTIFDWVNNSDEPAHLTLNFPALTTITHPICDQSKMIAVNLSACTTINRAYIFSYSSVDTVNLPVCTSVDANTFSTATIETLNMPSCTSFGIDALYNCNITNLILGANSVATCGINSGLGTITNIYVPDALVTDYENDNYWGQYPSGTIKPLSQWTNQQV